MGLFQIRWYGEGGVAELMLSRIPLIISLYRSAILRANRSSYSSSAQRSRRLNTAGQGTLPVHSAPP